LIDPSNLRRLIERHIPFSNLENAPIPVHVVATNLGGETICLSTGPTAAALLASAAIPAAFPSEHHLIDGAVASNTPILTASNLGANRIIVLPTGFACALREPPKGAIARALHALTLLIAHQMVRDLRQLAGKVSMFLLCPIFARLTHRRMISPAPSR
jgi:NTE family protein